MIAAVDAGGSFLKAALIHSDGRMQKDSFSRTPSASSGTKHEIISALADCLSQLFRHAARFDFEVEGIALGYPGPFDYATGTFLMKHKYQSVYGVPLMPEIHKIAAIPEVLVAFCHDIHTLAYGEYLFGAGKAAENLLCVAIGTGVGTGYIRHGVVMPDDTGGPRYSIYRSRLGTGTLEDLVSARGITHRYRQLGGSVSAPDPKEIQLRAEQGDAAAIQTYRDVGTALGKVLRGVIDEAQIDVLVFGGQISRAHMLFVPPLSDLLGPCLTLKRILPAEDLDYSSLRGAAALLAATRRDAG